MSESEGVIVLRGLQKSFKGSPVLKGIDFTVPRGQVLALLGPNGAGKTTTVRILSTLLGFEAGEAYVNGYNVKSQSKQVRASIGLTGQYAAVDEYLTGRQNLEMMGRLYHLSRAVSRQRTEELLAQFDLLAAAGRVVKTYSGGMRRRLDLAASLIATPPVLFLDEPTTGLDPRSRLAMWDIIEKLVAADVTILLTTQYLEEADRLADRIAVLDHGRIIAEGTPDELKSRVGKERLQLTLADAAMVARAESVFGEAVVQASAERRVISLTVEQAVRDVKHALDTAERHGIAIESLSMHKPTLDDVFLRFTGHEAADEAAKEPAV